MCVRITVKVLRIVVSSPGRFGQTRFSLRNCLLHGFLFDPLPQGILHQQRVPWPLSSPSKLVRNLKLIVNSGLPSWPAHAEVKPEPRISIGLWVRIGMEAVANPINPHVGADERRKPDDVPRSFKRHDAEIVGSLSPTGWLKHLNRAIAGCGDLLHLANELGVPLKTTWLRWRLRVRTRLSLAWQQCSYESAECNVPEALHYLAARLKNSTAAGLLSGMGLSAWQIGQYHRLFLNWFGCSTDWQDRQSRFGRYFHSRHCPYFATP